MNILMYLFWIGIFLIFYTYIGYPLVLIVLNKIFLNVSKADKDTAAYLPGVSLLITAYNEEECIGDKIENSLQLDYPSDKLEIWIASDGSTDKTNEIVKTFMQENKRIHLLEFKRSGKSVVLNKAMPSLQNDIVVFSDANTEYASDAIKKLVRHFPDTRLGCVCGRLIYRNPGEVISGKGESFYWEYETILKKMESKLGYVAGANGAIYAIRRSLFTPLPPGTINDDFEISMQIVKRGYRCIYEENAFAYEDVALTMESEFKRHVRDSGGHYIAVMHLLGLLNPFTGIRSFIYWSHRILRWFVPFVLIIIFILNGMLINHFCFKTTFILQVAFYVLVIIGFFNLNSKRLSFLMYIPFYFCNLNFALLVGFFKAVSGMQKTTWERTERS